MTGATEKAEGAAQPLAEFGRVEPAASDCGVQQFDDRSRGPRRTRAARVRWTDLPASGLLGGDIVADD